MRMKNKWAQLLLAEEQLMVTGHVDLGIELLKMS